TPDFIDDLLLSPFRQSGGMEKIMGNTFSSQVKVRSGMETGPCRPNLSENSSGRRSPYVVIIRSKFSSDPRPERVRQIYFGFYYALDFGRNAELRISSNCYSDPTP